MGQLIQAHPSVKSWTTCAIFSLTPVGISNSIISSVAVPFIRAISDLRLVVLPATMESDLALFRNVRSSHRLDYTLRATSGRSRLWRSLPFLAEYGFSLKPNVIEKLKCN